MKAYQLQATNGFGDLQQVELPTPQPQFGEILIRVQAAALKYRDLLVAKGAYPGIQLPLIPLSDGAGEVVASESVKQYCCWVLAGCQFLLCSLLKCWERE